MAKASRRITAVVAFLLLAGAAILATGPHKRLGAMIEKMGLDEFRKAVLGEESASVPSPTAP